MKWGNIILGIVCLLAGCAIYLVLRSETINLYRWCQATVGTAALDPLREWARAWQVPLFVKYSLPDGLYCASYILIASGIWSNQKGFFKHIVVSAIPLVAITHECLQAAGLARGTFDIADLICYTLPLIAYIITQIPFPKQ